MSLVRTIKNLKKGTPGIITPTVEQWLAREGDNLGLGHPDQYDLMVRLAKASARNSIRHARFGASARGTCERKQVFAYLGVPALQGWIGTQLQNIFNDGTFRHIRWQLMGMAAGVFTDVEYSYALPSYRLGLSMDAINEDHPFVFELKGTSLNISKWDTVDDIPPAHVLQTHTYLFATGWDLGIYVAEDKRTQHWKEVMVKRDPKIIQEVRDELNRLNEAIDHETLPPLQDGCRHKRGKEYRDCPYREGCLESYTTGDQFPEVDPRTNRAEWPHDIIASVSVRRRVRDT